MDVEAEVTTTTIDQQQSCSVGLNQATIEWFSGDEYAITDLYGRVPDHISRDLEFLRADVTRVGYESGTEAAGALVAAWAEEMCRDATVQEWTTPSSTEIPVTYSTHAEPDSPVGECRRLIAAVLFNYTFGVITASEISARYRRMPGIAETIINSWGVLDRARRDLAIDGVQQAAVPIVEELCSDGDVVLVVAGEMPTGASTSLTTVENTTGRSSGRATNDPILATGGSLGGVPLGADWTAVVDQLALDEVGERSGPTSAPECSSADLWLSWLGTGVTVRLDSDQAMFGYTLRAEETTATGPVDGVTVDLAGSGLGWGSTQAEVDESLPNTSTDPLLGDMIADTGDGLLYLSFGADGLSVVRAGDHCSPGGQVTVGDLPAIDQSADVSDACQPGNSTEVYFSPGARCLAAESGTSCGELGVTVFREGHGWCPEITHIQLVLNRVSSDLIDIDGYFGPELTEAVAALQQTYGLEDDGLVGPDTWAAMVEAYSEVEGRS